MSLSADTSADTLSCEAESVCDILSELHDTGNLGTPFPKITEYLLWRVNIITDRVLYLAVV